MERSIPLPNVQREIIIYDYTENPELFNNIETSFIDMILSHDEIIIPPSQIIQRIFNDYLKIQDKQLLTEEEFENLNKYNKKFDCSICMDYKYRGRILNCNHIFCNKCLKQWLLSKNINCPICRKNVKNK